MLQPLVTHTPSEKKDARKKLLKSLRAPRDVKFSILLDIADEATRTFLKNGSEALGVLFLDTADEAIMP